MSKEESNVTKYKLLNSKEILKEFEELFTQEKNNDSDCISLYDITNLIKEYRNNYDDIIDRYQDYFDCILEDEESYFFNTTVYGFDYVNNQLSIGVQLALNHYKIVLAKKNDDLYVVESELTDYQEVLYHIGKGLSELYDELIKFSDFEKQDVNNIKALNSNFFVDISFAGVDIYAGSQSYSFSRDFILSSPSYTDEDEYEYKYKYKCNSTEVLTALKGKEDKIFKRIFVKIDDCPEWSKKLLYQMRQEQIFKEQEEQKIRVKKRTPWDEVKKLVGAWLK